MTDFTKSLVIELVAAIIVSAATLTVAPYIPPLVEMKISLSVLIIIIAIVAFVVSAIYSTKIHRMKKFESSESGVKKFSCIVCGEAFEAFPPDDTHIIGDRSEVKDSIDITYACVNRHKNTIYWHRRKGNFK